MRRVYEINKNKNKILQFKVFFIFTGLLYGKPNRQNNNIFENFVKISINFQKSI